MGIDPRSIVKILVDDLVENDPKYKEKVRGIITAVTATCNVTEKEACVRSKFDNPDDVLFKMFSDAYFNSRKTPGCIEPTNGTCDQVNDQQLNDAIASHKNIIFEFTGQYIPSWLLSPTFITEEYNIIFSYSLVNFTNLVVRNKSRAYEGLKTFENGGPAFRLPNVSQSAFIPILGKIHEVLLELYSSCIVSYNEEKCGSRKIDQLLLFDNNKEITLIFDSKEPIASDAFANLIAPYFVTNGGKSKRLKKSKRKYTLRSQRR